MRLSGVFPPLTTPFERDEPALGKLVENIGRYEASGVAGYVVLGSTGETAYLSQEERLLVLRAARVAIPAGKPMIAGIGQESTRETITLAYAAADEGADAALVLNPFYFRSQMTEEALLRHFTAVADASPLPVLLYNVPKFTGLAIPPRLVERLAPHENVAGLKDSSGDLGWLLDVLSRVPATFQVLCGAAPVFQPALAAGATGAILAVANALPEPFVALFNDQQRGDAPGALALQKAVLGAARLIVDTLGVAGVKAAMDLRGLHGGPPRPPLLPAGESDRAKVGEAIAALVERGVLKSAAL